MNNKLEQLLADSSFVLWLQAEFPAEEQKQKKSTLILLNLEDERQCIFTVQNDGQLLIGMDN